MPSDGSSAEAKSDPQGRSKTQAVFSALLLLVGVGGIVFLTKSALDSPIPGSAPAGTPLADASAVVLPTGLDAQPIDGPATLVVFEDDDPILSKTPLSEMMALGMVNLSGHFGPVTAMPVSDYEAGDGLSYDAVIYTSTYGTYEINPAFLRDVVSRRFPVMWLGAGAAQLNELDEDFFGDSGWSVAPDALLDPTTVSYKETTFDRDDRASPTFEIRLRRHSDVEVLATSALPNGREKIYAVRDRGFTYVAEVPFDYLEEGNHSLVVADLLFDLLDPGRQERHQALVRLEDVGPYADPDTLRALADALYERDVPFSVAVYSIWRDPQAQYGWGTDIRLADRPKVVEALKYMESKGGTLLMHGVTHQYGELPNPYFGTSGEDFEFYAAYLDRDDNVVTPGPVEADSQEWVVERVRQGFAEMADAGLDAPTIFEFPHYAGSPVSYTAITSMFDARYEQSSYFPGQLTGEELQTKFQRNQFVPYPVFDVYGENVIPENLGNVIPVGYNNNPARWPEDIVATARDSLVVRDNVASFFFHPYLDIQYLLDIVEGMTELGYVFVSPEDVLEGWR